MFLGSPLHVKYVSVLLLKPVAELRKMTSCLLFVCCVAIIPAATSQDFPTLDHLKTTTPVKDQVQVVEDLIARLIGYRSTEFSVAVNSSIGPLNKDTFKLSNENGIVSITGTSGLAAAWGFYYYLSQFCGCHISWAGDQVNLPSILPLLPSEGVIVTSNDRFRYYQNVCTVSYSSVWWNWTRWERELDWMAMNGINFALAFTGQEAIWQRVLLRMGFTQSELDNHFGGAAFLAWSRMGNMHGWGGPLPQSWHTQQVRLQHKILDRMRAFGMIPILPAFAGLVPDAISRVFPAANVTRLGQWAGFSSQYCCTKLLSMEDPLFVTFGKAFIKEYIAEFGTDHVYNTDTFNENRPSSSDPQYLKRAGAAVFNAMLAGDPDAIWVMQGWLFVNDPSFWQPAQAEALLTSVPLGRMIVLDLMSETDAKYDYLHSYYGQPFIWNMLNNFGGTIALFGNIDFVNEGPKRGRDFVNSTMIGVGITMEGINQNDMIYEFMLENSWRKGPRDLTAWVQNYSERRYGKVSAEVNSAWQLLKAGVYNCTSNYHSHGNEVVVLRPQFDSPIQPYIWYNTEDFFKAWDYMILASSSLTDSSLYRYDLVDVTRQALQVISILFYNEVLSSHKARNHTSFMLYADQLRGLLLDLDELLATDSHFLLGRWIEDAKAVATNEQEAELYEYNARNQLTLWGPDGNILDYANKQWAGLVQAYYFPRWNFFLEELDRQWNATFDQSQFNKDVFSFVEEPFTFDRTLFPTTTSGDQIIVATRLHKQYRSITRRYAKFFRRLRKHSEIMDMLWLKTKTKGQDRMWTSGDRMQSWRNIGRQKKVMSEVGKRNDVGQRLR